MLTNLLSARLSARKPGEGRPAELYEANLVEIIRHQFFNHALLQ